MIFRRKYKVLVLNPAHLSDSDMKKLAETSPLPVVVDCTIPNGFCVRSTVNE